jgi:hypothetical protein
MKFSFLWLLPVLPVLVWLAWPQSDAGNRAAPASAAPAVAAGKQVAERGFWLPPALKEDDVKRVPLLPIDQSQSASQSLAQARVAGDARTPPIEHVADATPGASSAELADPKAYAAYETRQNLRVYAQFVQAAEQTLPQLRADIERGKQLGIPADKIARAEEKYRRIAAEQASLLQQHPELAKVGAR